MLSNSWTLTTRVYPWQLSTRTVLSYSALSRNLHTICIQVLLGHWVFRQYSGGHPGFENPGDTRILSTQAGHGHSVLRRHTGTRYSGVTRVLSTPPPRRIRIWGTRVLRGQADFGN